MNSARILVAGRAAPKRKELRAALEFERHQVAEAETGDRAIEEASSRRHDLLIVDQDWEGTGLDHLCRTIRSQSELGIIVLGGDRVAPPNSIEALNAGADDYVPAPLVLPELLA